MTLANEDDMEKTPSQPKLNFTPQALTQINFLLESDYTLEGLYFRIKIQGKGCEGFTYASGFSSYSSEDILVPFGEDNAPASPHTHYLIDSFTAFYLQEGEVDFVQDLEKGEEGFRVTNFNERKFFGKFWKQDQSLIPPIKEN